MSAGPDGGRGLRIALLTSTALMTGLLAGPAAAASSSIAIGGYFQGYFVTNSDQDGIVNGQQQPGYGLRNYAIFRRSRIEFAALAELDNGLKAGFTVDLRGEAHSTDQVEMAFAHFTGGFGRLEIGKTYSAPYKMFYGAPTPIPGLGANSPNMMTAVLPAGNFASSPVSYINFGPGFMYDRMEKVSYFTPRVAGFQFGASYTPNNCMIGVVSASDPNRQYYCGIGNGLARADVPGSQQDIVEAGVNYTAEYASGVTVGAYVGGGVARLAAQQYVNSSMRNQSQIGLGASVAWAGWTFGADYRLNNLGNKYGGIDSTGAGINLPKTQVDWQVGATYGFGAWTVGFQYHDTVAQLRTPANTAAGDDRLRMLSVGGTYNLGPGIQLASGIQAFRSTSYTAQPSNENRGWNFILGTNLSF